MKYYIIRLTLIREPIGILKAPDQVVSWAIYHTYNGLNLERNLVQIVPRFVFIHFPKSFVVYCFTHYFVSGSTVACPMVTSLSVW